MLQASLKDAPVMVAPEYKNAARTLEHPRHAAEFKTPRVQLSDLQFPPLGSLCGAAGTRRTGRTAGPPDRDRSN